MVHMTDNVAKEFKESKLPIWESLWNRMCESDEKQRFQTNVKHPKTRFWCLTMNGPPLLTNFNILGLTNWPTLTSTSAQENNHWQNHRKF